MDRIRVGRFCLGTLGLMDPRPSDGDDGGAGAGIGREYAMIPMSVHAGRRDEGGETLEEFEWGES